MYTNRTSVPNASNRSLPPAAGIETAILRTVAYVDVFNYPLTAAQVHRYLEGVSASREEIEAILANGRLIPDRLSRLDGYFTLPGREEIVAARQAREVVSQRLWPRAIRYGRLLARLPFVRMVAVTGSLTMNNAEADADIDYLVVTECGRLWLCRAFIIALVRLARRDGVELCPNYILSEDALKFPDHNLYVAHEITQMVPLSGLNVYQRIRQLNAWADELLPNAAGPPYHPDPVSPGLHQSLVERPLRTPVGRWLEQWEMNRKIRKLRAQETEFTETDFCADWCKGHFDAYNRPTMRAYQLTITNYQLPQTKSQLPITPNQEPNSNHQSPITHNPPPTEQ
ncbi:MAG: hypothetical protein ACE5E7_14280 [Anaerolineae bacterium]